MTRFLAVLVILLLGFSNCWAQKKWEDPRWDKWKFKLAPYFWYIGINATISRAPIPSQFPELEPEWEIDVKFRDIAGSLKFAFMLYGEYQPNRGLIFFNFTRAAFISA